MIYLITSEQCPPCKQIKLWMCQNIEASIVESCIEMVNVDDPNIPHGRIDMLVSEGIKSVPCLLHYANGRINKYFGFNDIKEALLKFERACNDNQ